MYVYAGIKVYIGNDEKKKAVTENINFRKL